MLCSIEETISVCTVCYLMLQPLPPGLEGTGALTTLQKPKDTEELVKVRAQLEEQLKMQRAAAQAQKVGIKLQGTTYFFVSNTCI